MLAAQVKCWNLKDISVVVFKKTINGVFFKYLWKTLPYTQVDDIAQLPPIVKKLNQNILEMSTAVLNK